MLSQCAWVGNMPTQAQERNFMERLTIQEQLRFYIQWCEDNHLAPKEAKNLNAYVNEIKPKK